MEKTDYEKLTKQVIEIIKNCKFCTLNKITVETKIKDIKNDNWVNYNILWGDPEEFYDIVITKNEMINELCEKTVKDLIDYVAKIIDYNEEIYKLIKENEARLKEIILNDEAIRKIKWNNIDRKSYETPDY